MIVNMKNQIEDLEIDDKLRQFGVKKAARTIGVSGAYLFACLAGNPISERIYKRLKKLLILPF